MTVPKSVSSQSLAAQAEGLIAGQQGILPMPSKYGNEYLSHEELAMTGSRKDGIDLETENALRIYGCEIIQEAGILLKLPQYTIATAQVNFHRFYYLSSFAKHDVWTIARGAVYISCKAEETMMKKMDVLNVFEHIFQKRFGLGHAILDTNSELYKEVRADLFDAERELLRVLGFVINTGHPHKFTLQYVQSICGDRGAGSLSETETQFAQTAWNYTNDSFRTVSCLLYPPEIVAAAAVCMAARDLGVSLPSNWEAVWDVTALEVNEIVGMIEDLYARTPVEYMPVCKAAADKYKKRQDALEAKKAAKAKAAEERKEQERKADEKREEEKKAAQAEREAAAEAKAQRKAARGGSYESSGSRSGSSSRPSLGPRASLSRSSVDRSESSSPVLEGSPGNRRPVPKSRGGGEGPAQRRRPPSPSHSMSPSASPSRSRSRSQSLSRSGSRQMMARQRSRRSPGEREARSERRRPSSPSRSAPPPKRSSGSRRGSSTRGNKDAGGSRKEHKRSRSRSRERGRGERGDRGGGGRRDRGGDRDRDRRRR